jgi:hypothetical protein
VTAVAARKVTGDIKLEEVQIRSAMLDLHLETPGRGPATLDLCRRRSICARRCAREDQGETLNAPMAPARWSGGRPVR